MKTIVCFGDSLIYGYGIEEKYNLISQLQRSLPFAQIINGGQNGDTSLGGLYRLHEEVLPFCLPLFRFYLAQMTVLLIVPQTAQ